MRYELNLTRWSYNIVKRSWNIAVCLQVPRILQ